MCWLYWNGDVFKMADESLSDISALDISKLKVPDLKKELKMRGLSATGNKNELLERLQQAIKSSEGDGAAMDSVDDLEEDLLNDDDDEHLDASESVILDNELDDSPKAQKRKISEALEQTEVKTEPPKKVILNRNNSINVEPSKTKSEDTDSESKSIDESQDKKVIKLSQLSAKERLEMRAKKFGVVALSTDAKKAVRAERFGLGNNSASNIKSSNVNTSVDVLKQRAERFGGSVSTVMSILENKDKLEKRKERFGEVSTANGVSQSDKAKQRLERFKEPVK